MSKPTVVGSIKVGASVGRVVGCIVGRNVGGSVSITLHNDRSIKYGEKKLLAIIRSGKAMNG